MASSAKPNRAKASKKPAKARAAANERSTKRGAAKAPTRVRKNMDMDPEKLRQARKILGTSSDTETVDKALDLIVFRGRFRRAMERLAAAGGVEDIWGRM